MTTKIKPQKNDVYKTAPSLDAAWLEIKANLPITDANQAFALLMQYHNTLIQEKESHEQA